MMTSNIPAFPMSAHQDARNEWSHTQYGMELRDYFAGQALIILSRSSLQAYEAAAQAYRIADAMLEVREAEYEDM